ncbi:MAG TPA: pyridoxamine 5'-phosphate oxidase family protein [Nitrososphaeraceae archaeon]|jgi:general stress protein 26|nr:pyridoxamine 5'-phosphate oxidase family protein [Nitrososphaeraceae archaeon]
MIIKGMGTSHATIPAMNEQEVINFLQSKLNLQLATIDENGDPNIQPVWFDYEKDSEKLHVMTSKMSNKVRNIRSKSNVYFSIDDENFPYKGVKGKAIARIIEDHQKVVSMAEKINIKYLGTLEHPLAKMLMEFAQNGTEILLEISPKFFSTWDFAKA